MMKNLFKKDKYLYVNRGKINTAMEILTMCNYLTAKVGNCGWAKTPDVYFMMIRVTDEQYKKICRLMNKYGVELLDETVGR